MPIARALTDKIIYCRVLVQSDSPKININLVNVVVYVTKIQSDSSTCKSLCISTTMVFSSNYACLWKRTAMWAIEHVLHAYVLARVDKRGIVTVIRLSSCTSRLLLNHDCTHCILQKLYKVTH